MMCCVAARAVRAVYLCRSNWLKCWERVDQLHPQSFTWTRPDDFFITACTVEWL